MKTLTFNCKIISPLRMAGAHKNLELRETEIKGLMRFWWRAWNPTFSIMDLKKNEAEIFGGSYKLVSAANEKLVSKKSSFSIHISNLSATRGARSIAFLPHKGNGRNNELDSYERGDFIVEFRFRDTAHYENVKNIFILSTILGGFGLRARRGFSSIQITQINNIDFNHPNNLQSIFSILKTVSTNHSFNSVKIFTKSEKLLAKFPYIDEIYLANNFKNSVVKSLLHQISSFTSGLLDNENGKKLGGRKFAAPVYVSLIELDNEFIPILTKLNSKWKWKLEETIFKEENQNTFINKFLKKTN